MIAQARAEEGHRRTPAFSQVPIELLFASLADVGGVRGACIASVLRDQFGDKPVQLPSFEAFVTTPPLEGLGTSVRTIRNLIRDDPEAIELLDRALERPTGKAGHNVDNVNVKEPEERPDGNSAQQAIRKLRKDRPDLLERVKAKELTPHAAMIEAGFRVRQIQVPAVPAIAARRLAKHFDVRELIAELSRYVHD